MRTVSLVLIIAFSACGGEEGRDNEYTFGIPGKGDGQDQNVGESPFDPASCTGSAHYPRGVEGSYTLEIHRRTCSGAACTTWEQVDLSWPTSAMQGRISTAGGPHYPAEGNFGYRYCCSLRWDAFAGKQKTLCGWGYCNQTRSVLSGDHPAIALTNSRGNNCKARWHFWGDALPREETLGCAFTPGGLSCEPYAYAVGCLTRQPTFGEQKIKFTEGTITERCVRLVARNQVETTRPGTFDQYQIGLLAFFE